MLRISKPLHCRTELHHAFARLSRTLPLRHAVSPRSAFAFVIICMSARQIVESEIQKPEYWRAQGDKFMADIVALERSLEAEFNGLDQLDLRTGNGGALHINLIKVKPEFQGQGIGSKVMTKLKAFAQERGIPITLSPEPDRGKKAALQRFYKGHGFWKNKGRRADYRYTSPFAPIMIWKP